MKYIIFLLLSGCALRALPEKPVVLWPIRAKTLPVHIVTCEVNVCNEQQCAPPKAMFCMEKVDAKNYGKNVINANAYIKQLENILNTVTEPKK